MTHDGKTQHKTHTFTSCICRLAVFLRMYHLELAVKEPSQLCLEHFLCTGSFPKLSKQATFYEKRCHLINYHRSFVSQVISPL